MNWKKVRLELAPMEKFPRGSASRAYLLHVPLNEAGRIDCAALQRNPSMATVRRFWPSQADDFGHIVKADGAWSFRCGRHKCAQAVFRFGRGALELGRQVTIEARDGGCLRFRVASVTQLGASPAL